MMRFGFVCLLSVTTSFFSLAQVVPDTTQINIGDKTIIVIDAGPTEKPAPIIDNLNPAAEPAIDPDTDLKYELNHFAGVDFGYCMLLDSRGSLNRDSTTDWLSINNGRSLTWRLNILEAKARIYQDYVGIYTGFAVSYCSYGFTNNISIDVNDRSEVVGLPIDPEVRQFYKNKLRTTTLQIPVMIEFNTRKENKKNFHFAIGALGGLVSSVITKQKWETDDERFTERRKSKFRTTPYTLDLSFRIGYRKTALFFTYALTPLFKANEGFPVYPISFGVQLIQF
ncbi:MAG: hypothetical protein RL040_189 [Bacteroidota bacterium]